MEPQKHESGEKRLIRWLLIATLALLVLVLALQAGRMLFPGASENPAFPQDAAQGAGGSSGGPNTGVSSGKAAMIEDVQARNPALSFDDLAALSAEELEQLCEAAAPPEQAPIGLSRAAQLAEEYAGTLEMDSVTWDADPELDETPAHYEVELHHVTLGDFDYRIDAYTGEVLEGQPDILQSSYVPASGDGAQGENPGQAQPAAPRTDAQVPQAPAPSGGQETSGRQGASGQPGAASGGSSGLSGEEAAKAAAFAHAGVAEADAEGLRVESDWEDGTRVYEIKFRAGGVAYDYEIEAATGAVRKAGQEWGGAASGGGQGSSSGLIREEAAKAAALTHAGVDAGNLDYIRWELDREDGVQVYEIEFTAGGMEYDYEIDAATGAVRKAERETAD